MRLGVRGEDHQDVTAGERADFPARAHERQRAGQAADVEHALHTLTVMLAVILESGEPTRVYTALSLLVSTAADGEPARGLVSFGALPVLLGDPPRGEDTFGRTLAELRRTAADMEDCRLWACAAAVETQGVDREEVERHLDGVMSTPRFLRETEGARLVVV